MTATARAPGTRAPSRRRRNRSGPTRPSRPAPDPRPPRLRATRFDPPARRRRPDDRPTTLTATSTPPSRLREPDRPTPVGRRRRPRSTGSTSPRPARPATSPRARCRAGCSTSTPCRSTRGTCGSPPPRPPPTARSSSSAVYVLDADTLAKVGKVGGLGEGERIYSVRFIGPVGYVVTFRQVDPLYTLDLRDPAAPEVTGELKITGYSAYLHPAGDGRLIGVGQEASEKGRTLGTQVSLFDVSDPADAAPAVADVPEGLGLRGRVGPARLPLLAEDGHGGPPAEHPDRRQSSADLVARSISDGLRASPGAGTVDSTPRRQAGDRPASPRYDPGIRRSIVIGDSICGRLRRGLKVAPISPGIPSPTRRTRIRVLRDALRTVLLHRHIILYKILSDPLTVLPLAQHVIHGGMANDGPLRRRIGVDQTLVTYHRHSQPRLAALALPLAGVAQGEPGGRSPRPTTSRPSERGKPDLDNRRGSVPPPVSLIQVRGRARPTIRWNALGTPAVITGSAPLAEGLGADPEQAARAYLKANERLFGLSGDAGRRAGEDRGQPASGTGHAVLLRQRFGDLPAGVDGQVAVGVEDGKVRPRHLDAVARHRGAPGRRDHRAAGPGDRGQGRRHRPGHCRHQAGHAPWPCPHPTGCTTRSRSS